MITREEYIKALDIVEAYHKQIGLNDIDLTKNENKTRISDWDKLDQCSSLLANRIINLEKYVHGQYISIDYLEDVTKQVFFTARGLGEKSWKEFVALRGY